MPEDYLPPHSLAAEESVLGSLLLDPACMPRCDLNAEDFYREKNRWMFEAMRALEKAETGINQITVAHEMAKSKQLEAMGGADYLSHLINQVPTTVHFQYYQDIVAGCSTQRQIVSAAGCIAAAGIKGDEEGLDQARKALDRLQQRRTKYHVLSPNEYADAALRRISQLRDKAAKVMPFGIKKLDDLTGGGLYGGEYVILGARPGMGKSTFMRQLASHMGDQHVVLFAQAEMSKSQTIDRDIGAEIGMSPALIRRGNFSDKDMDLMTVACGNLAARGVHHYIDGSMTTQRLRRVATRIANEQGLGAIFVDYLQILRDRSELSSYERISHISSELLGLCNDLDVPMVVAAQLSRKLEERRDRRPMLSDLRDSGKVEENADAVLFLYRADAYLDYPDEKCPSGHAELHIAKHRQGGELKVVRMKWDWTKREYKGV